MLRGMRLSLLTDAHLVASPADDHRALRFHNAYELEAGQAILARAVDAAVEARPDAIVLLGDLANDGDAEVLQRAIEVASRPGIPVWAVAGNHDVIGRGDGLATAAAASGRDVTVLGDRGIGVGGFTVVGVAVTTDDGGETGRGPAPVGAHDAGDEPLLVLSHLPLLSLRAEIEAAGFPYAGDLTNLAEVAGAVLARRTPTVVLSGHLHARVARSEGPLLQLVFPALVEEPHEIAVVDLERDGTACRVGSRTLRVFEGGGGTAALLGPARASWRGGPDGWRAE